MKKNRVQSSNIKGIGYNPSTLTLEIEFRSGGRYVYLNVPSMYYKGLMASESQGEYFHQHIRDAGFEYYRVPKGERVI